jgi:hypothetical protein
MAIHHLSIVRIEELRQRTSECAFFFRILQGASYISLKRTGWAIRFPNSWPISTSEAWESGRTRYVRRVDRITELLPLEKKKEKKISQTIKAPPTRNYLTYALMECTGPYVSAIKYTCKVSSAKTAKLPTSLCFYSSFVLTFLCLASP